MKSIYKTRNRAILSLGVAILSSLLAFSSVNAQEKITGLNDFTIYLDPGHALKENQGLYNYSEAEKTVRVALSIREYLQTYTDIKAVYMCREDDNKQITLKERTDEANALDVDFYYSIHSDAGTPGQNTTLVMYGGWKDNGVIVEKTPKGGKIYSDILCADLTGVMRIGTRGSLADRTYYDSSENHANKYPYLHVNRESNMASVLSEAGYHTNPTQQSLNMNAEWKRMEGLAAFRSIVKYAGATSPNLGFLVGIIKDDETGVPVNGATVKIASKGKEYTTDSYESLFNKYSKIPDELHNGFYFFEGLSDGESFEVEYSAPGFETVKKQITIATNSAGETSESLNFTDISLLNLKPATVKSTSAKDPSSVSKDKPLQINFDRKMDRASVESALSFSPNTPFTVAWKDDYTLDIDINSFEFLTQYTLIIDGSVAKNSHTNSYLDGNADGVEGGNFVLTFTTAEQDAEAPYVVSYDPINGAQFESLRPIVRIEFNELLEQNTIALDQLKVTTNNGSYVRGVQKVTDVNGRTVMHYLFNEDLEVGVEYNVEVSKGIEDLYGNELAEALKYSFVCNPTEEITEVVMISDFESNTNPWRNPDGSGSTSGINKDVSLTSHTVSETATVESQGAMKVAYQWDEANNGLFRIRLYRNSSTPKFTKDYKLQSYVFGDASGSVLRFAARDGGTNGILSNVPIKVDWAGWKLVSWDIANDPNEWWLVGAGTPDGKSLYIDSYGFETPQSASARPSGFTPSFLCFDELRLVKTRQISGVGINDELLDEDKTISIVSVDRGIDIKSISEIKDVKVYTLSGMLVKSIAPNSGECAINNLSGGVYIIKVMTEVDQKLDKIVVR